MRAELIKLWSLALPLSAAFLAEYLMFLSTKTIIGKTGYLSLAAVGIAGDMIFELSIVLMGFLSVIGVLIAHADGSGKKLEAGQALHQGMLMAFVIAVPGSLMIWNLDKALVFSGQTPEVIELAQPFFRSMVTILLPILWFAVLRSFVSSLGRSNIIFLITTAGVFTNAVLAYWLIHGGYGLPALGPTGAGLALSITNWIMFALLAIHVLRGQEYQEYLGSGFKLHVDPQLWLVITKLGLPVCGLVLLEASLFVALSLLSGRLGAEALAATQILLSWLGLPFVLSLGIANATMIRVARWTGAANPAAARAAGWCGLLSGPLLLLVLVIVPIVFADEVINLFLRPDDPGRSTIISLVKQLLVLVACFQLFDGTQVICSHALRGMRDTLMPLWIATFGYWFVGIGAGVYLAFYAEWGLPGLWAGLALGITLTAMLLTARFNSLTRS